MNYLTKLLVTFILFVGCLQSSEVVQDILNSADSLIEIKKSQEALEDLSKINLEELELRDLLSYLILHSQALLNLTRLDEAYSEALEAYKLALIFNDSTSASRVLITAGNVNMRLKQTHEALSHYTDALNYLPKADTLIRLKAGIINNQAIIYRQISDPYKAYELRRQALQLRQSVQDSTGIASSLNNIGSYYSDIGQYDSARIYFNRALSIKQGINDFWGIGNGYNNLSICFLKDENIDSALFYAGKGLAYGRKIGSLLLQINSYNHLRDSYKYLENWERALDYQERVSALKDSLFDIQKTRQINEMQVRFNTERKEKENQLLRAEQVLSKTELARQRLTIFTVFLLLIIVSLVALFLLFRNRANSELHLRDNALHEKNEAMLAVEIAHRERELSSKALTMVQKNELMLQVMKDLDQITQKYDISEKDMRTLHGRIDNSLKNNSEWEEFQKWYEGSSNEFLKKLKEKYSDLTAQEIRLAALIRLNFTTKEIASLTNRSSEALEKARYRLRKKLGLQNNENLNQFLISIDK